MSLTTCLRELTREETQISQNEKREVCLEERKDGEHIMDVTVTGLPNDCIVLRLEKFKVSGLKGGPWKKRCDFAILHTNKQEQTKVLLIELKRQLTRSNVSKGSKQLVWGSLFMDYLISLCKEDDHRLRSHPVEKRLVVLGYKARIDKRPLRGIRFKSSSIIIPIRENSKKILFSELWAR